MIVPFLPTGFDAGVFNLRDDCFHLTVAGKQIGSLAIHVGQQLLARRIHIGHGPQIDVDRPLPIRSSPPPAIAQFRHPRTHKPSFELEGK
ncbi:MAG TPA: hypothetical protein VE999_00070 [Gemmataceae bacterium]|nr:hypothetical protein [Gemmataceae bacterium]